MGITGAEPAGDRPSGKFWKVIGWKVSGKVYDCWNLRGPPMGEAPARSSLVPRDLTAELCLIALASLGLLLTRVCLTAYLNLLVRIYVPRFARNFLLLGIRLAAFFISCC